MGYLALAIIAAIWDQLIYPAVILSFTVPFWGRIIKAFKNPGAKHRSNATANWDHLTD